MNPGQVGAMRAALVTLADVPLPRLAAAVRDVNERSLAWEARGRAGSGPIDPAWAAELDTLLFHLLPLRKELQRRGYRIPAGEWPTEDQPRERLAFLAAWFEALPAISADLIHDTHPRSAPVN